MVNKFLLAIFSPSFQRGYAVRSAAVNCTQSNRGEWKTC
jgi:hypothetical protein